jgi:hypothetical protein
MLKNLRLLITGLSLLVCVCAVAFWVRSFSGPEIIRGQFSQDHQFNIVSHDGLLTFNSFRNTPLGPPIEASKVTPAILKQMAQLPVHHPLTIVIPHLSLAALAASFAALLWIQWSRRFSLRTLLAATALIAVMFGAMVSIASR